MFGVYDIMETVGQGGMGVVYRAQDTALDRIVALKVLKEDLRQSKQIAARFQREAEAIASLNHPNIVHIYSVGAVGRIPYIAMEFITGAPLSTVMKRIKSIPWKRALHIAEQVAEALACAHDTHIIHRDIKPGNILIGANDRAYVTDFGIAKVLTAETQLTVEGSRLGTPHYMSPERCGKGDITPSSDLYSLGVVLFQMLSGKLPYEANAPVELIRKIVTAPPARLSEVAPDLPDDVERLVAYLIEKKPADRPKSAADVARMCRRVIEGEPLFDDDSMAISLKDFREHLPTPSTTSTHIDSALGEARGLWSRAGRVWRCVPAAVKLWGAGAAVIALMAALGQWTVQTSYGGYALATVNRWDQSTLGWSAVTSPAEWTQETDGVNLAQLAFWHFDVRRVLTAGANQFAVELTQGASTTMLIVDGAAQYVRVALPPGSDDKVNARRVVAGGSELEYAFYYQSQARRASGIMAPALLRLDSALVDDSLGKPLIFLDDLQGAAGARVTEVVGFSATDDRSTMAIVVRAQGVSGVHVVQVETGGSAPAFTPLLLGVDEIAAMTYDNAGDLYIAQRTTAGWSCVRFRAGAAARRPQTVLDLASGGTISQVTSNGALVKNVGTGGTSVFEWRVFGSMEAWIIGDGAAAAVLPDGGTALVSAADRRGNMQLWRVTRDTPEDRVPITFLEDGIAPEFSVSHDGRYALGQAKAAQPPALVLVDLESVDSGA